MRGWGLFFFLLFLLLVFAVVSWVAYNQINARRDGRTAPSFKSWKTYVPFMPQEGASNYPAPRSTNPLEWIREQFGKLTNRRTARGAYEEAGPLDGSGGGGGGFGGAGGRTGRRLEDDAWDTRVGNEDPYGDRAGYSGYEEQELGLAPTPGLHNEPYGGGSSGRAGAGGGGDYLGAGSGYNDRGRPSSRGMNPFGDQNEAPSLRSLSPRPHEGAGHSKGNPSLDTNDSGDGNTSPISTRKSVFREGI
ncbi:hypothetical protein PV10_07281 [Exophiala mesophila]|uniref:Uncharacterized protein n=1 Tax=Exophiala mesophila TaxID=212818 RepID=A0A0D1ZSZ9_EXOME|nr:uncharacterized protein PV10_07281 [Exophiala mesophila]KIV89923.1 hypothetical protein PV10_07281 [Exophiala mesophila]